MPAGGHRRPSDMTLAGIVAGMQIGSGHRKKS
jgi:hypothetical protein